MPTGNLKKTAYINFKEIQNELYDNIPHTRQIGPPIKLTPVYPLYISQGVGSILPMGHMIYITFIQDH
jgi:hypothetical protein